jgi:hypothetical protein
MNTILQEHFLHSCQVSSIAVICEKHDFDFVFFLKKKGIAGEYGTPMWAFIVNRGQGISSYGTANKDTAMMEFNSANKVERVRERP